MSGGVPAIPWHRPMSGRDPNEEHRASTPLELFFDLCFVVAVAAVAATLHHDLAQGHLSGIAGYTMVFFVSKLRRDPRFGNPTIVAVTDRTDLDDQLAQTFTGTHLEPSCRQAAEIADSRGRPANGYVLRRVPQASRVFQR